MCRVGPRASEDPEDRALSRPHASVLTEEPALSLNMRFFHCEAGITRDGKKHERVLLNGMNPTQPVWSVALGLLQGNEGQHSYDPNADLSSSTLD